MFRPCYVIDIHFVIDDSVFHDRHRIKHFSKFVSLSFSFYTILEQPTIITKFLNVVVEHQTPNREVLSSIPTGGTVLCP